MDVDWCRPVSTGIDWCRLRLQMGKIWSWRKKRLGITTKKGSARTMATVDTTKNKALENIKTLQNELTVILKNIGDGSYGTLAQISAKIKSISDTSNSLVLSSQEQGLRLRFINQNILIAQSEISVINLRITSMVAEISNLISTTGKYIDAFKTVFK